MGPRVLIDTNIIIDLFRDIPGTKAELRKYSDRAISIVTWMEVMSGLRDSEGELIELLESDFRVLPFSRSTAEETVQIRRSSRLKLPDAMILATAHVENRVLVTRNTRDFVPGRFVRIPYIL